MPRIKMRVHSAVSSSRALDECVDSKMSQNDTMFHSNQSGRPMTIHVYVMTRDSAPEQGRGHAVDAGTMLRFLLETHHIFLRSDVCRIGKVLLRLNMPGPPVVDHGHVATNTAITNDSPTTPAATAQRRRGPPASLLPRSSCRNKMTIL